MWVAKIKTIKTIGLWDLRIVLDCTIPIRNSVIQTSALNIILGQCAITCIGTFQWIFPFLHSKTNQCKKTMDKWATIRNVVKNSRKRIYFFLLCKNWNYSVHCFCFSCWVDLLHRGNSVSWETEKSAWLKSFATLATTFSIVQGKIGQTKKFSKMKKMFFR